MMSFRFSCRMVSLTAWNTKRMFSVSIAVVKWWKSGFPGYDAYALAERPFYEQWWFLLVLALGGLILVLLLVCTLLLHGHSHKYSSCSTNAGKHIQTAEESVTLDNGGFTSLELNSRSLNTKNSFLKKNGTRSPPRPSPGGLHYSDEDVTYNGAVLTESTMLTEKAAELSGSELSDSDYEDEPPKHSFVNHYMSDPTYFNSWKRARGPQGPQLEQDYPTVVTQHPSGGAYTPGGQPAHTHPVNNPPPGSRTPVTGFSSFV
ncbi:protein sidekick-1-like [Osmerus eperlanus]|uniref:protein sidekick-1-like n=1 Tax=Osmerus eperlanus TaxID=29151 RepID=UPI002E167D50